MFEISPVSDADYQQWLELWQGYLEFYETELSDSVTKSTFERILAGDYFAALAKDEQGKAIGLAQWHTHRSTWRIEEVCYLNDLFVSPEQRSLGVGKALIDYVVDWSKQRKLGKVYWLTAETNATARLLYDKLANKTGFIQYEVRL